MKTSSTNVKESGRAKYASDEERWRAVVQKDQREELPKRGTVIEAISEAGFNSSARFNASSQHKNYRSDRKRALLKREELAA